MKYFVNNILDIVCCVKNEFLSKNRHKMKI